MAKVCGSLAVQVNTHTTCILCIYLNKFCNNLKVRFAPFLKIVSKIVLKTGFLNLPETVSQIHLISGMQA